MVTEITECFVWGFLWSIPFLFVVWIARQLKRYFTAASNIKVD